MSHTSGHGTVSLAGDYVAERVHLGYALTVHKAQGVTVDHALLVADDTTTAEALYVGMTRGHHNNTALVVVDTLDPDLEQRRGAPTNARDLLVSAMGRVASEEAAITALRSTLAASESLAVLAPRLANVQAEIARETPDNPEPNSAASSPNAGTWNAGPRPGILTRAGRHDRQALRDLDDRINTLAEARNARYEHADLFAYRDALAQQVTSRRQALGAAAVAEQPGHLVDLLGPVPDDDAGRTDWASRAGRVETYRERWGIEPGDIGESPVDDIQRREWAASIQYLEALRRLETHPVAERGIGLEL